MGEKWQKINMFGQKNENIWICLETKCYGYTWWIYNVVWYSEENFGTEHEKIKTFDDFSHEESYFPTIFSYSKL